MSGGENEFVDGFRLAELIQRDQPEIWEAMTTVPIEFLDTGYDDKFGSDYYKANSAPMVELDRSGRLWKINYNNQMRDSLFQVSL